MTVVMIVGVLAIVGVMLLRKHLLASKTAEVFAVIESIRAAQERYRAENRQYLDVSQSITNYYPAVSDGTKRSFFLSRAPATPINDLDRNWRLLAPVVTTPVLFGYATTATVASAGPTFFIQAQGDLDNYGAKCTAIAASYSDVVRIENEGE